MAAADALTVVAPAQTIPLMNSVTKDLDEASKDDTGENNQSKSFQIMTDNKYSKLHLELAALSGNQKIVIMNQDNTTLKTLSIAPTNGMVSADVDVSNTKAIFVEITDADNDSKLFVPLTTSSLTK